MSEIKTLCPNCDLKVIRVLYRIIDSERGPSGGIYGCSNCGAVLYTPVNDINNVNRESMEMITVLRPEYARKKEIESLEQQVRLLERDQSETERRIKSTKKMLTELKEQIL